MMLHNQNLVGVNNCGLEQRRSSSSEAPALPPRSSHHAVPIVVSTSADGHIKEHILLEVCKKLCISSCYNIQLTP